MENLICDTNIWYGLAECTIDPEKLKAYNLIGTAVSLAEIASTPMLLTNFELVKECIKALMDHHHFILKSNFYDHIICLFDDTYMPDNSTFEEVLQEMTLIPKMDYSVIPQSNIDKAKAGISSLQNQRDELIDYLNSKLSVEKKTIEEPKKKRKYKKADFTSTNKQHIIALVNDYTQRIFAKDSNMTIDHPGWKQLEFFLKSWGKFFLMIDTQSDMKLNKNDFPDLFNLVYVQPGYKYATRDKKWVSLFKQDKTLSQYFVEL